MNARAEVPTAAELAPIPLPKPPSDGLLPASMRATATDTSYIGTNRAAWQVGYVPSTQ